jgi:hypothetical protein
MGRLSAWGTERRRRGRDPHSLIMVFNAFVYGASKCYVMVQSNRLCSLSYQCGRRFGGTNSSEDGGSTFLRNVHRHLPEYMLNVPEDRNVHVL